MLDELRIENFAIIDTLELTFHTGFNVITGETGAGKSIILDAMELIMGGKADSGSVRAGADKAIIEGTFKLDDATRMRILPILEEQDLLDDEDNEFITLAREVRRNGRTVARINGTTTKMDILSEVGGLLVDIHGQSSHLSLFKPKAHIDLLDRYADLLEVRDALTEVTKTLSDVRNEMRVLQDDKEELERKAERLRYEVNEIDAVNLEIGEMAELEAERNRLANSEQLASLAQEANMILNGDDDIDAVITQIQTLAQVMEKLAKIDGEMQDSHDIAEEIADNLQELSIEIASYVDEVEYDPDRLNELEERIETIKKLKRRYKVETIEAILDYAETARSELNTLEHSDERLEELRKDEEKTLRHIGDLCARMTKVREIAGRNLGKRIMRELKDLRMENTQFEVVIEHTEDENGAYIGDKRYAFSATGRDKVEFMMSANPGEPLRPLAKVASGGESARIMLALKRVLTQTDETPTLIFDEIDQGIGGRIGSVVGEKLWSLTNGHQVMVVTHLPQLASYGDIHYQVKKSVSGDRTTTHVKPLDSDPLRVDELAEMLGASGDAGLESARELLVQSATRKTELLSQKPPQKKKQPIQPS